MASKPKPPGRRPMTRSARGAALMESVRKETAAQGAQPVSPDTDVATALLQDHVDEQKMFGVPGGAGALADAARAEPDGAWRDFECACEVVRHEVDGNFTGRLSVKVSVKDKVTGRYVVFNPHDMMMNVAMDRVTLGGRAAVIPMPSPAEMGIHSVS